MPTDPPATPPRPEALNPETSNLTGVFGPSPSQTVGPYFHQGLADHFQGLRSAIGPDLLDGRDVPGERIILRGHVLDGDGNTVEDALIEVWQADSHGQYAQTPTAAFPGYGRTHTRAAGHEYTLRTIKPGPTAPGHAPRLHVWLGLRGLLTHLVTAVYFSDDDHSTDPLLNAVPEHRRATLIARRRDTPGGTEYHLDFHLQGPHETAFFDAY